jgi:hypothetical protein
MAQVDKLETKDGVVEIGENMVGGASQVGHKVRVRFKKNRVAAPYRTAQFTLSYDSGIVDVGNEIFDLAKSLGVIYHPVNPETGKENPQMWKFGDHDPVRGEANIRQTVNASDKMQAEIIETCNRASDDLIQSRNLAMTMVDVDESAD